MKKHAGEKRIKRKANPKKVVLRLGFVLVLFYVITTLVNQQFALGGNAAAEAKIQAQLADAQKNTAALNSRLSQVNTDSYIEYVARTKLGLVKPGEKIFVDAGKR